MTVSRIDPESDHCRPRDAPFVIDNRYLLLTSESLTVLSKPEVWCGTLPRTSEHEASIVRPSKAQRCEKYTPEDDSPAAGRLVGVAPPSGVFNLLRHTPLHGPRLCTVTTGALHQSQHSSPPRGGSRFSVI